MNIFDLAQLQLQREGKARADNYSILMLDRAIKIRKWLDMQERNKKVALNRCK